MGNKNSGKRKYGLNERFFGKWSSKMAYVLGFTCADGNVHGRTLSWDLSKKFDSNLHLLRKFSQALDSDYPVKNRPFSYKLSISSSQILEDIRKLGVVPNKKKILVFPKVPRKYLEHFVRGFLDGDGWISIRKRNREVCVGFSNGSINFMEGLIEVLREELNIRNFNLRCREKQTKYGEVSKTYQLDFYSNNAKKILSFLYGDLSEKDLVLSRKYDKYTESLSVFKDMEKFKRFGGHWIKAESLNENLQALLSEMLDEKRMLPRELAKKFRVSLSTIYRWLDASGIRSSEKRGSEEWSKKILSSKRLVKNVQ